MIRVEAAPAVDSGTGFSSLPESSFLTVNSVQVNGYNSKFIVTDLTTLLVAFPQELQDQGVLVEAVTSIRINRVATDAAGVEVNTPEVLTDLGGPDGGLDTKAPPGSLRATLEGGILQLSGANFDKAVGVYVNRKSQGYVIMDNRTILCTLPQNDVSIDDVEVVTTSRVADRSSLFAYLFTDNISSVSGEFKLVQQFVKVLLTTPGSDVFNKTLGGNLQNWVGQKVALSNPQGLVAKTVLNIINTGVYFAAQQAASTLPPEERLSDVQVLNISFDPSNPSVMDLSLRLNTFARRQATISLLIGAAEEAIKDAGGL